MRIVADTNVVLSGLFYGGKPGELLDAAARGEIELYTSPELLDELRELLDRPKFTERLKLNGMTADELLADYEGVVRQVESEPLAPAVSRDPDDDWVLATAVAAQADLIVSGDKDLLTLKQYEGIPIISANQAVQQIGA